MHGFVDLGFNEISSSTGANDTFTEVEINWYPNGDSTDGLNIHSELDADTTYGPRDYMPIEGSFYVLPENEDVYAEIILTGTFGTEESGATSATFTTTGIDRLGVGYQMVGFSGQDADDDSDTMLIYEVKPLDHVVPIIDGEEFADLLK